MPKEYLEEHCVYLRKSRADQDAELQVKEKTTKIFAVSYKFFQSCIRRHDTRPPCYAWIVS